MALRKALWLQNTSYQPDTDRLGLSVLFYPSGNTANPLEVRAGVLARTTQLSGGQPFQVTVNAGMILNVGAGNLVYPNWHASNQGAYIVTNDATQTVTIATSDPTFGRYDVIYVQVKDSGFGDATDDTILAVAQGTPASSPAVPSVPTGAFKLAQIFVGAGVGAITSGNITDLRTETTTVGGPLRVASAAALPANPYEGQRAYQLDKHLPVYYNGSVWVSEIGKLQSVYTTATLSTSANFSTASTTYVDALTASTGGTTIDLSITKILDSTTLAVRISVTTSGLAILGVRVDGTTDHDVSFGGASGVQQSGLIPLTGVSAGTHTFRLRMRTTTSNTASFYASTGLTSTALISVEEHV